MNIEPGPGYRLLKEGEQIKGSDEVFSDGEWRNDFLYAQGYSYSNEYHLPMRRKIEPQEGWIPIGDPAFTEFPCWHCFPGGIADLAFHQGQMGINSTLWMPAQVPAPPPVEDPVEVAASEFAKVYSTPNSSFSNVNLIKHCFKAGVEWQKQQKPCQEK